MPVGGLQRRQAVNTSELDSVRDDSLHKVQGLLRRFGGSLVPTPSPTAHA